MRALDPTLFKRIEKSAFRRKFHLSSKDLAYVQQKGFDELHKHASQFVAQRLSAAEPAKDGKQTPYRGHPVFIAQHATATCCRTCLMKWHGIGKGVELTPEDQQYVAAVIVEWIKREANAHD